MGVQNENNSVSSSRPTREKLNSDTCHRVTSPENLSHEVTTFTALPCKILPCNIYLTNCYIMFIIFISIEHRLAYRIINL